MNYDNVNIKKVFYTDEINDKNNISIDINKLNYKYTCNIFNLPNAYYFGLNLIYSNDISIDNFLPSKWKIKEYEYIFQTDNTYKYFDQDGIIHTFIESYNDTNTYIDSLSTGLILKKNITLNRYIIIDTFGNETHFNSDGNIIYKKAIQNNGNLYTYLTYQYVNNKLHNIINSNNQRIEFEYNGNYIDYIIYKCNNTILNEIFIDYEGNRISKIRDSFNIYEVIENNNNIIFKINNEMIRKIDFLDNKVSKISFYNNDELAFLDDNMDSYITFLRREILNQTIVREYNIYNSDDELTSPYATIYNFSTNENDYGSFISKYESDDSFYDNIETKDEYIYENHKYTVNKINYNKSIVSSDNIHIIIDREDTTNIISNRFYMLTSLLKLKCNVGLNLGIIKVYESNDNISYNLVKEYRLSIDSNIVYDEGMPILYSDLIKFSINNPYIKIDFINNGFIRLNNYLTSIHFIECLNEVTNSNELTYNIEYVYNNIGRMMPNVNLTNADLFYTYLSYNLNNNSFNLYYNNLNNVINNISGLVLYYLDSEVGIYLSNLLFRSKSIIYSLLTSFVNERDNEFKFNNLAYENITTNNNTGEIIIKKYYDKYLNLIKELNEEGIISEYTYTNNNLVSSIKKYYLMGSLEKILDYDYYTYNNYGQVIDEVSYLNDRHLINEYNYYNGLNNKTLSVYNNDSTSYNYKVINSNISDKLDYISKGSYQNSFTYSYDNIINTITKYNSDIKYNYDYEYDNKNSLSNVYENINNSRSIVKSTMRYFNYEIEGIGCISQVIKETAYNNILGRTIEKIVGYDEYNHLIIEMINNQITKRYIYGSEDDYSIISEIDNPLDSRLNTSRNSILLKTIIDGEAFIYHYFPNATIRNYGNTNQFIEYGINSKNDIVSESIMKRDENQSRFIYYDSILYNNTNIIHKFKTRYKYLDNEWNYKVRYDYLVNGVNDFNKLRSKVINNKLKYKYNYYNFDIEDMREGISGESKYLKSKEIYFNNNLREKDTIIYSNNNYNISSIIKEYNGATYNINYTYNIYNELIEEENYELSLKNKYYYDDRRNINTIRRYNSNNVLIDYKIIDFDSNNKVSRIVIHESEITTILSYHYDILNYKVNILKNNNPYISYKVNDFNQIIEYNNNIDSYYYKYYYNSNNERIRKEKYNNENQLIESHYYTYINNRLIFEKIKQGNDYIYLTFIYDDLELIGFTKTINSFDNPLTYYYIKDINNNIIGISDDANHMICRYLYDSFGNIINIIGDNDLANLNPYRYRGYYYDNETSLYWLSSRYYDPSIGRFISPDSVDYLDPESINGLNLYAYCNNDPVNYCDPSGHLPQWAMWLIGGAVIVGLGIATVATGGAAGGVAGFVLAGALKDALIGAVSSSLINGTISGISSAISGDGFWSGFGEGAAHGFMSGAVIGGITGAINSGAQVYNASKLWANTGNKTGFQQMVQHYGKHVIQEGQKAVAKNIVNYSNQASQFFTNNYSSGVLLRQGVVKIAGAPGGIYNIDGLIRSFWYI